jgi:hypothetical protein
MLKLNNGSGLPWFMEYSRSTTPEIWTLHRSQAVTSTIDTTSNGDVWHLVATRRGLAALGCSLVYMAMTMFLGEWSNTNN